MPHIIIEHSKNIFEKESLKIGREIQKIMSSISEGNFDPDHCKIRAIAYQNYIVGLEKNDENYKVIIDSSDRNGFAIFIKNEHNSI